MPTEEESIDARVQRLFKAARGQDRVIIDCREQSQVLSVPPPLQVFGMRFFLIASESTECTHDPRCTWADWIILCCDRSAIVEFGLLTHQDMQSVLLYVTEPGEGEPLSIDHNSVRLLDLP